MEEIEKELCGNCKKEIPHHNYVMHTAHCTRNISLCNICKEPFPKSQIEDHKKTCEKPSSLSSTLRKVSITPPSRLEESSYFKERKEVEDKKAANRQAARMQRMERLVDCGEIVGRYSSKKNDTPAEVNGYERHINPQLARHNKVDYNQNKSQKNDNNFGGAVQKKVEPPTSSKSSLTPCKYCELELPKLDLDDHENYCGARTDKCPDCGEIVMFKYRDLHQDTNHGFLKLNDEPGPRPSWEASKSPSRTSIPESPTRRNRSSNSIFRTFSGIENFIPPSYGITSSYSSNSLNSNKSEKLESSKEISRRLDCPAPQPPRYRNPPTELLIPCEFCDTPIPHEDLIQHETGCRPDLTRYNYRRRRSPSPPNRQDDEEELPCEFCSNLIPASQLWRHQETCN
ncbi:TRAF-type zinc finger domain-containing protein 1 isoform X3 [Agrilus planipennis]|uniref:TRAF-type zinc finger domain-containing protein 1 isoform X3 n=1 Tax=Agrilus planipennis TaxID=224129 RepID=A0A1W4XUE8_AGRPL|nr:TRAF-type zinc finger domain-containing protein 1 isoform X3 [Agrilus planipennis]